VAIQRAGGPTSSAVVPAEERATPRAITRYLASLKPVLAAGTDARGVWVRFLVEAAKREDQAAAFAEAQQVALGQGQAIETARRTLHSIPPPTGLEDMHRTIDKWLRTLAHSCEAVFQAPGPLTPELMTKARNILHEAGAEADRFNRQRQTVVESLADVVAPPQDGPKFIANTKEIRALAITLVLALLLIGGGAYAVSALGDSPTPTPTTGSDRRVFPQPEILNRLKAEILSRKVAWQDADVVLVAPDLILVKGKIFGGSSQIPVEVELQMSVTEDGKPKIATKRLSAVGVTVPPEAFDALNKRVDEANKTLPDQIPAGYTLKRLFVENNAVVVELQPNGAPTKPGAPPAKPGTKPGP
jgi:hypothetical protein